MYGENLNQGDKVRVEFRSPGGPWVVGITFGKIVELGTKFATIVVQDGNKLWRDRNTGEALPLNGPCCRMSKI